jgi:organic hydroperoxide reductase OsmC/OhrA
MTSEFMSRLGDSNVFQWAVAPFKSRRHAYHEWRGQLVVGENGRLSHGSAARLVCFAKTAVVWRRKSEETMETYTADINWKLADGEDFPKGRYSRGHTVSFDGGTVVPASASPHVVGSKWSVKEAVDPEEMLVAALSDCHMFSFLHVARLAGFTVAAYRDHAEGTMEELAPGKQAITKVVLHPQIEWIGEAPDKSKLDHLHHEAHEVCFIASSAKTNVTVAF